MSTVITFIEVIQLEEAMIYILFSNVPF